MPQELETSFIPEVKRALKKNKARGSGSGWRELLSVAGPGASEGDVCVPANCGGSGRSRRVKQRVSYKEED